MLVALMLDGVDGDDVVVVDQSGRDGGGGGYAAPQAAGEADAMLEG
jgi:hypothetical protein